MEPIAIMATASISPSRRMKSSAKFHTYVERKKSEMKPMASQREKSNKVDKDKMKAPSTLSFKENIRSVALRKAYIAGLKNTQVTDKDGKNPSFSEINSIDEMSDTQKESRFDTPERRNVDSTRNSTNDEGMTSRGQTATSSEKRSKVRKSGVKTSSSFHPTSRSARLFKRDTEDVITSKKNLTGRGRNTNITSFEKLRREEILKRSRGRRGNVSTNRSMNERPGSEGGSKWGRSSKDKVPVRKEIRKSGNASSKGEGERLTKSQLPMEENEEEMDESKREVGRLAESKSPTEEKEQVSDGESKGENERLTKRKSPTEGKEQKNESEEKDNLKMGDLSTLEGGCILKESESGKDADMLLKIMDGEKKEDKEGSTPDSGLASTEPNLPQPSSTLGAKTVELNEDHTIHIEDTSELLIHHQSDVLKTDKQSTDIVSDRDGALSDNSSTFQSTIYDALKSENINSETMNLILSIENVVRENSAVATASNAEQKRSDLLRQRRKNMLRNTESNIMSKLNYISASKSYGLGGGVHYDRPSMSSESAWIPASQTFTRGDIESPSRGSCDESFSVKDKAKQIIAKRNPNLNLYYPSVEGQIRFSDIPMNVRANANSPRSSLTEPTDPETDAPLTEINESDITPVSADSESPEPTGPNISEREIMRTTHHSSNGMPQESNQSGDLPERSLYDEQEAHIPQTEIDQFGLNSPTVSPGQRNDLPAISEGSVSAPPGVTESLAPTNNGDVLSHEIPPTKDEQGQDTLAYGDRPGLGNQIQMSMENDNTEIELYPAGDFPGHVEHDIDPLSYQHLHHHESNYGSVGIANDNMGQYNFTPNGSSLFHTAETPQQSNIKRLYNWMHSMAPSLSPYESQMMSNNMSNIYPTPVVDAHQNEMFNNGLIYAPMMADQSLSTSTSHIPESNYDSTSRFSTSGGSSYDSYGRAHAKLRAPLPRDRQQRHKSKSRSSSVGFRSSRSRRSSSCSSSYYSSSEYSGSSGSMSSWRSGSGSRSISRSYSSCSTRSYSSLGSGVSSYSRSNF